MQETQKYPNNLGMSIGYSVIDLFKCEQIKLLTIAGFTLLYARYGKPRNGYDDMQLHARIWKGLLSQTKFWLVSSIT